MVMEARQKLPHVLSYHPPHPKTVGYGSANAKLMLPDFHDFAQPPCVTALVTVGQPGVIVACA